MMGVAHMYRVMVFLLLNIGLYFLFKKAPAHRKIKQVFTSDLCKDKPKKSYTTTKKIGLREKFHNISSDMLKLSKMTYKGYMRVAMIFSLLGVILGMMLNNVLLSVVLGICMIFIPLEYLKVRQSGYIQTLNEQMETVLSIITNSYLQSGDIIISVKENLHRIEQPFHNIFKEFLAERTFIDSNLVKSIRKMQRKVDNQYFNEWCDTLVLCQYDHELRFILPTIIEKLADLKQIQEELNTQMINLYKDHISVSLVVAANIPLMRFLNADWYRLLTSTLPGQIIVAITFLIIFLATAYVIKINKPVSVK
jgi:hypothetical protein